MCLVPAALTLSLARGCVLQVKAARAKREEFRLLTRSVDELHQLLDFLEVEGVDKLIIDKHTLVQLIVGEKEQSKMASRHAGQLMQWHVRASGESADVRGHAISTTEQNVSTLL